MNDQGFVVVTGASTGIGRATAIHLAKRGFVVLAGVRREEDAASIRGESVPGLEPLFLATSPTPRRSPPQRMQARTQVGERGLAGLVNNAGIALGGPIEFLPLAELRRRPRRADPGDPGVGPPGPLEGSPHLALSRPSRLTTRRPGLAFSRRGGVEWIRFSRRR